MSVFLKKPQQIYFPILFLLALLLGQELFGQTKKGVFAPFIIENGFYDLIHSKHNKLCIIDVDFKNVNNKHNFIAMSINIQSLNAKFTEFKELLECLTYSNSPDIICIQELWQFPANAEFDLAGYQPLFYKLRAGSVQGAESACMLKTE